MKTLILVDKTGKIVCKSWIGDDNATERQKLVARQNLKNTPERLESFNDNGDIFEIEDDDVWIGDSYENGIHTKNSTLRTSASQAEQKKVTDKTNAINKLLALGLTQDEIEALIGGN